MADSDIREAVQSQVEQDRLIYLRATYGPFDNQCDRCGSLLGQGKKAKHIEWHEGNEGAAQ